MKKIIAKYIPISQMIRKVNKSLKAWVAFIKKVQKEENLSYPDAMKRAKVRKDGGEKWMGGTETPSETPQSTIEPEQPPVEAQLPAEAQSPADAQPPTGGKGGNKKQKKTAKTQQKTSKKQKGGRRKTCYKK
jgi:hypothetical protein